MAVKVGSSSLPCVPASFSSPFQCSSFSQRIARRPFNRQHNVLQFVNAKAKSRQFVHDVLKLRERFTKSSHVLLATSGDQPQYTELDADGKEQLIHQPNSEDISPLSSSPIHFERYNGKPGFLSFYNRPYKREDEVVPKVEKSQSSVLWLLGPTVLVASFIFPSLYLRKIISTVFEDSLLTDFLILFFTEALFYCGVGGFLRLIESLRSTEHSVVNDNRNQPPQQLGERISSVATLVLSLIIPMVTMGFVWPWTGPAASATLTPYLVGIVVQFAFEQYARYRKTSSWPVIQIIFQVYRLHQLNRAAQLVTALSFTLRGAETTAHNLAINSSLRALINVLQVLGIICIWSLSTFLMKYFSSNTTTPQ